MRGYWISQKDADTVKRYFKTSEDPLQAAKKFQEDVRERELIKRHKKITDLWDADLSVVPALPKDWERWVDKVGIQQNYIFYHYVRGGAKTGFCTFCGKEVALKHPPHYNEKGKCPRCHHDVVFKSYGKSGTINTGDNFLYLIQRCAGGFVVRQFVAWKYYYKADYESPQIHWNENRRIIYNLDLTSRDYFWGNFKQREWRWIAGVRYNPFNYYFDRYSMWGKVYGKTLPSLAKKELRGTGLYDWIQNHDGVCDPEEYLEVLRAVPQWEKLWKANLPALSREVWFGRSNFKELVADPEATSLVKILGLDTSRMHRLRRLNGNSNILEWLRYEKAGNQIIPDETLKWLAEKDISRQSIDFILDRMNPSQVYHYVQKQGKRYHIPAGDVISYMAGLPFHGRSSAHGCD